MAQIKTFKEIRVWHKAHELVLLIYKITKNFPSEERFGLTSQIRRATISIASNIVEGFRRKTLKDTLNFYNISESSLEEVKYQLLLAFDLQFINNDEFTKTKALTEQVGGMLYLWIKSQKEIKNN